MSTIRAKRNTARRGAISTAKLLSSSALTAAGLLAFAMNPAHAETDTHSWNELETVAGNVATDTTTLNITNINVGGNGNAFVQGDADIASSHTVNVFANRFAVKDTENDPTYILGKLNSTGQIIIIDSQGIFFGENSQIDVSSIIATTGDISVGQVMNTELGAFEITNITDGKIELHGTVTVADAGLAAFVAPTVTNSGVINAKMGKVALASGEAVTLDLYGDKLVEITVEGDVADALVENSGTINANGGVVQISAKQAKQVVDNIINVSGIVDVSSVTQKGGKIILGGGDKGKVAVSGTLDATGTSGGDVEVTGQFVSAEGSALIDASGANGGGTIHFGGDWQGQGDTPTSEYAYVGQDAILRADAEVEGDGGEVVTWSDKVTGFFGLITARGGANGGNGGQVETSSKGTLLAEGSVDASAANGVGGEWLLDPENLTVASSGAAATSTTGVNPSIITAITTGTNSVVTNTTIQTALNAGTSVTLRTGDGNAAGEQGDITVNANIQKTGNSNATLRMESHDDIIINNSITVATGGGNNGQLNLILLAGYYENGNPDSGQNDVVINAALNTNGGNLEIGADHDISGAGAITTEGGSVHMVAGSGFHLPIANYTVDAPNHDSNVLYDGSINTDGGNVYMNAGDDIRIGGAITTNGGSATFVARGTNNTASDLGDVEFKSGGSLNTARNGNNNDGNVFIQAENFLHAGFIVATEGTVTLGRSTLGTIDVGDNNGSTYNIGQSELYRIIARNLIIGDTNTSNVTVDNVDMFAQFSNTQDNLPTPSQGCENQSGGNPNCASSFEMKDTNLTLAANDLVDIIGTLTMGTGWVKVDAPELDLDARVQHKASLAGAATDLINDSRLLGTQRLVDIDVLSNAALIQQAIYFADSTAQKEIDVSSGTYTENLIVNKSNLKLDGSSATVSAASNANNALVLVTGSNVNIDPFIFDGNNLVNYGIFASNAGANGLIVDGNTFREFNLAGIHVDNNTGGTSNIFGNTFEGTMQIGVELGAIVNNSVVNIYSNDIGTLGNRVDIDGIQVNSIATGADVNIYDNDIFAEFDGVYVHNAITGAGTTALIAGNRIDALQDGLDLGSIAAGAVVNVGGTDRVVGGLAGTTTDDGNTIKAGVSGIEFDQGIESTVNIDGNKIAAGVDGINIRDEDGGDTTGVDGGTVNIRNNDIGSDGTDVVGGNGIRFIDSITNAAKVLISGNNIGRSGARVDNGIMFENITGAGTEVETENNNIFADVDGVVVNGEINGVENFIVETSTINANQHGVAINGNITNADDVQVNVNDITANGGHGVFFNGSVSSSLVIVNGNTNITAEQDGVHFAGPISGGFVQVSGNNDGIVADDHGIYFGGNIGGGATLNIHDNIISANVDGGIIGAGIFFNGTVTNATVNIGNGDDYFTGDPSNIITVAENFDLGTPGPDDGLDGIHFDKEVGAGAVVNIDGNRIGYTGTPNTGPVLPGNLTDDGIEFTGNVTGNAQINIGDNGIDSFDNGILFNGTVGGTSTVVVGGNVGNIGGEHGNYIVAGGDGVRFNGAITGEALIEISNNIVNAGRDGVLFNGAINNGKTTGGTSEEEILIRNNEITGAQNGINFAGNISNGINDIRIHDNRNIIGTAQNGITFGGTIDDADVQIYENGNNGGAIRGGQDGIYFAGAIQNSALVEVRNNELIEGLHDDAVDFNSSITGASIVRINDNRNIRADNTSGTDADNGIEFAGVNGSTVEILRNNHGIHANDHGIYFGGNIVNADLDIHDNIINADDNNNGFGDGIRFDGEISGNSTVNIGDGDGSTFGTNPSNIISGEDGIHFNEDVYNTAQIVIDGNRIGYDGTTLAGPYSNNRVGDDGIEFADSVYDAANVTITDNYIRSEDDGVRFANVNGTGTVLIGGAGDGNTIDAQGDGVQFGAGVYGERLVEISYNNIDADDDGVLFSGTTSNADLPAGNSQQEIFINENTIVGGDNGIRFVQNVNEDLHDIRITNNSVRGLSQHGINFNGNIGPNESQIWILNNDLIEGYNDGIHFNGTVSGDALVEIVDNTRIEGLHDDGIDFVGNISGNAVVRINGNDNIRADNTSGTDADNGIEFAGVGGSSTVEILGNNHGIHSNNHGIYFGGVVGNQSDIDIHDNIINADDNNNGTGDGIHFASDIENQATINIGDGSGATFGSDPSNIISGHDGIHFAGNLENQVQIVIDGNRLGYDGSSLAGPYFNDRLGDDGIQVEGELRNQASFIVTDNHIRAEGDGVSFLDNLENDAYVLIGGAGDGNTIDANDDGIQFEGDILHSSLINISYNDIDADADGIRFDGDTSNADSVFPYRDDEILITRNDIVGGDNGISFHGRMSGDRHDIRIEENDRIIGQSEHGIVHTGGIDASELWILDNDEIYGWDEGIEINGNFFNDAHIEIADNSDVDSGFGAGITLTDFGGSGGADLNIVRNHVHYTGDDGIYVENIDGTQIADNYIHETGGDAIHVRDSSYVSIDDNFIRFAGDDGIDFENGSFSSITDNNIRFVDANGIEVEDSSFILIDDNTVQNADDAGIFVDPSAFIAVTNNLLRYNNYGVRFEDVYFSMIYDNTIEDNDIAGIRLNNSHFIGVWRNDIIDNPIGLWADGGLNGYINVTGNKFVDNGTHARFESGIIDLTGVDPLLGYGNTFMGGNIGLEFDAAFNQPWRLSLVRTGGLFAGGFTYDGNPFDTFNGVTVAGSPALNFGGTIGSQYFDGQSQSFVTLRSDTFVDGRGRAIWLDASDSTFFMPGEGLITGDVLTPAQFAFLESMFRHWPDVNNRGIFWFGAVPAIGGPSVIKDPVYNPFNAGVSGLNITITGLPRVGGFAGGGVGPAGLNAISPAAGDEEGTTPTDLANIEPAAGEGTGQSVTCWGDAVNAAGVGGPVNYSYGGTFEESISAAATCGAESF